MTRIITDETSCRCYSMEAKRASIPKFLPRGFGLDLNHLASLNMTASHQTDEATAATMIPLSEVDSQEFEVDVFAEQKQHDKNHSAGEQDERAGEVENFQRERSVSFPVTVLSTYTSQPELLQSLHSSCVSTFCSNYHP